MQSDIWGWNWQDFEILESTNDYALNQELPNQNSKLLFSAKTQTKGRGRRGRNWISKMGNLYMSQLFFSSSTPQALVYITALSLAALIKSHLNHGDLSIKWPNDILIDGKKVGGILIEKAYSGAFVIGIGVNLEDAPDSTDIIYPATSLKNYNVIISRENFIAEYLKNFEQNIKKSFKDIRLEFLSFAYKLKQEITVDVGKRKISGVFQGIDENGFLLLQQGNNTMTINTGEILFL